MQDALAEAHAAYARNEVPIGAVIVHNKTREIIARASNTMLANHDPTAHAEIQVIRQACALQQSMRLADCDLYVTLEPCPMCAQAISFARIERLYFGAYDPKSGGVDNGARIFNATSCHYVPEVYGGIMERECAELLVGFFKGLR